MVGSLSSVVRAGRGARLSLFLFVLLLLPAGGTAEDLMAPKLQFDVFLGHDGLMREASWTPVVCELRNNGEPINGFIEVSGYGGSQTRRVAIELPTGTLKRITIPVFCASRSHSTWDARLRDHRGKVRAEQLDLRPRRQLGWEAPFFAALPRTASGLPVVRPPLVQQEDVQPAVARWQSTVIPDNPLVLEGLDSLYLNSARASELTSRQSAAVLSWLHAGGHLIVAAEEVGDVNAVPWLRDVFPCALQTVVSVNGHGELQDWLRSGQADEQVAFTPPSVRGRPGSRTVVTLTNAFANLPDDPAFEAASLQVAVGAVKDGRVVVQAEGKPLIVEAARGRGRVTALLFSPEREPARSWKNLPTFWAKITEVPQSFYQVSDFRRFGGWSTDGLFGAMIDSRQVRKLPVPWLMALLVVYLLVIGPLDRWWLKKINRPMLTWITFPCYVVLFSVLIYFIGYKLRAGETEWNELHVVDVLPGDGQAELRGRTFASVYSPVNAAYAVEGRQQFAALRSEYRGGLGGGRDADDRNAVLQAGDNFKAEVFVPVWTSQLYVNDWWQSAAAPLTFRISPRGSDWEVKVENRLDRTLTNARLIVADKVFELEPLPARQTKTITVSRSFGKDLRGWIAPFYSGFQNAAQSRQRALGTSAWINNQADASQVVSFASLLSRGQNPGNTFVATPGLDLSPLVKQDQAVLLAWAADSAPVAPLNQFKAKRGHHDTLYRVAASVEDGGRR